MEESKSPAPPTDERPLLTHAAPDASAHAQALLKTGQRYMTHDPDPDPNYKSKGSVKKEFLRGYMTKRVRTCPPRLSLSRSPSRHQGFSETSGQGLRAFKAQESMDIAKVDADIIMIDASSVLYGFCARWSETTKAKLCSFLSSPTPSDGCIALLMLVADRLVGIAPPPPPFRLSVSNLFTPRPQCWGAYMPTSLGCWHLGNQGPTECWHLGKVTDRSWQSNGTTIASHCMSEHSWAPVMSVTSFPRLLHLFLFLFPTRSADVLSLHSFPLL